MRLRRRSRSEATASPTARCLAASRQIPYSPTATVRFSWTSTPTRRRPTRSAWSSERSRAVTVSAFLEQLRESQLLAEPQLEELRARAAAAGPDWKIASALIADGILTVYQVERIEAGHGSELSLGQYRILGELGRGGFGCVYKAAHALMDRIVAL